MGSDETAASCYEYFHVGCFIAGCFYVYCVRGQYSLLVLSNATSDVGCKSEETAVNCVKVYLYMEPTFTVQNSFTGVRG
jgi:hypothetical protein